MTDGTGTSDVAILTRALGLALDAAPKCPSVDLAAGLAHARMVFGAALRGDLSEVRAEIETADEEMAGET